MRTIYSRCHIVHIIYVLSYDDYMIRYMVRCMVVMSCVDHMIKVLLYNDYIMNVTYGPLYTRSVKPYDHGVEL